MNICFGGNVHPPQKTSSGVSDINGELLNDQPVRFTGDIEMDLSAATWGKVFGGNFVCTQPGILYIIDVEWRNNLTSVTGAQAITIPAGTLSSCHLGLLVTAAAGAAVPAWTITYTNEISVAGRTSTGSYLPAVTNMGSGCFFPCNMQAGDRTVSSVQSFNYTTAPTNASCTSLMMYNIIAAFPVYPALSGQRIRKGIPLEMSSFRNVYAGRTIEAVWMPMVSGLHALTGSFHAAAS